VAAKNPQFLPFFDVFWSSAFSDLANWHQSQKVEHRCTTTTFPYPMASKSFLYSNDFMAKSGTHSLTFLSVTDRQTDKKLNVLATPAADEIRAPPNLTW